MLLTLSALFLLLALLLIAAGLRLATVPDVTIDCSSPSNTNRKYTRYAHKSEHLGE